MSGYIQQNSMYQTSVFADVGYGDSAQPYERFFIYFSQASQNHLGSPKSTKIFMIIYIVSEI